MIILPRQARDKRREDSIQNAFFIGDIHDDEGVFHDTVDIEICGFCCYVLWTPEGLMAQLVRKTPFLSN
eukprot:COSAG06_NODE_858_length_11909_cov_6.018036_17_plen_69_part_00